MRGWSIVLLLLLSVGSSAGSRPGQWSKGTPAAGTQRVLSGPATAPKISLPDALQKLLVKKTLVIYFSPTCPHCRDVAPELNGVYQAWKSEMDVIAVTSDQHPQASIDEFRQTFSVPYPIVQDKDFAIGAALGVRSTPIAVLLEPGAKRATLLDGWFPYRPGTEALIALRLSKDPWKSFGPGEYKGNLVCGSCHVQEMESWQLTHHSVAWRTLVRHNRTTDEACTACHVTGAGQPTGWDGTSEAMALVDVGCEACHGPGGPHDGTKTDASQTCGACHDNKHSIGFDRARGTALIDHFKASVLDDAAFIKARVDLMEGKVPQAMVGFTEGRVLGSKVCAECHAEQVQQWHSSGHAGAMKTLQAADKASDATCVRCHASPEAFTASPVQAAMKLDEGVTCEVCHGSGEAHVASKGQPGTIQGLGEQCSVCVIEALCTSCHTKEWDPSWQLERSLQKVGH